MSYGYLRLDSTDESTKPAFPIDFKQAHSITKCLQQKDGFWVFAINEKFSLSATIAPAGTYVVLHGKESTRGFFSSVERQWDEEFRECFVCHSSNPPLRWVIGINAYDVEGVAEHVGK